MAKPIVTVVITVYGRTQFLRQALLSALNQTYKSYEIIVTDDSDSEAIREIVESFASPLIRYRGNNPTLGVALSLRATVEEARGDYIAILNDDDVWEPEFLSTLVKPLEQDVDCVLSFSDHWVITGEGTVELEKTNVNTARHGRRLLPEGKVDNAIDLVLNKNGIPLAMAAMFRKDAVCWELLVKEVSGAYDFWISCLLVATGRPVYFSAKRLTHYRVHSATETARKASDKNENMVFIYKKLLEIRAFSSNKALLTKRHSQAIFQVGKDNLYFNQHNSARTLFMESLKTKINLKAMAGLILSYFPQRLLAIFKLANIQSQC